MKGIFLRTCQISDRKDCGVPKGYQCVRSELKKKDKSELVKEWQWSLLNYNLPGLGQK